MIIYYSGFGCKVSDPEVCLGERANIMLSFNDSRPKVHARFKAVYNARKVQCESSMPGCTGKSPRKGPRSSGGSR